MTEATPHRTLSADATEMRQRRLREDLPSGELRKLQVDLAEIWHDFSKGASKRDHFELLAGVEESTRGRLRANPGIECLLEDGAGRRLGVLGTLVGLLRRYASSDIRATGLYSDRGWDTLECLHAAAVMEADQRLPRRLKFALLGIGLVIAVGSPTLLLYRYGFNDEDLRQISNMAQFIEAFAAALTIFAGWWIAAIFVEGRLRTRRALAQIHRCRVLIQLIDSHVLSNDWVAWWLAGAANDAKPKDTPELDREAAADYLRFAAALARIVAKIAALHAQWVPRPETMREADELFRIAAAIEQNCILKIQLVRGRPGSP